MARRRLAYDVAAITLLKLAVLAVIFAVFFTPARHAHIDPAAHIAGDPPSKMDFTHGRR